MRVLCCKTSETCSPAKKEKKKKIMLEMTNYAKNYTWC